MKPFSRATCKGCKVRQARFNGLCDRCLKHSKSKGVAEMGKTLHQRVIEEVPGSDGFWRSSTEDDFKEAADKLSQLGMSPDEIIDFLAAMYSSVSDEYGN